jgi:hypothetical protein
VKGPEHYRLAESLADEADKMSSMGANERAQTLAACSRAHAALALVALSYDTSFECDNVAEWGETFR